MDLLSQECWETVFLNDNVNTTFNNFLNTYLRIFYSCFPIKRRVMGNKPKPWLTQGIKILCANKRKLYETYRYSRDPNFKQYYKKYSKTLMSTIAASKKRSFDGLISESNNKIKTVWNIVKTVTNKRSKHNKIFSININDHPNNNPLTIANAFNNFFSSVASNLNDNQLNYNGPSSPLLYLKLNVIKPTSTLNFNYTTTYEINSIIQSLEPKDPRI